VEDHPGPPHLTAHVVDPGPPSRLHGYDVEGDLACHYNATAVTLLTVTGELPDDAKTRAAATALSFWAPAPITEAPAHAVSVARLCGATNSAMIGIGAITLAEQVNDLLRRHRDTRAWLADAKATPPVVALAADDEERTAVDRLRSSLRHLAVEVAALAHDLNREAAILAVLAFAGVEREEMLATLLVTARLPCVMAEGLAQRPHQLHEYAMDLPLFRYRGEDD
jgi:hypothetical protein